MGVKKHQYNEISQFSMSWFCINSLRTRLFWMDVVGRNVKYKCSSHCSVFFCIKITWIYSDWMHGFLFILRFLKIESFRERNGSTLPYRITIHHYIQCDVVTTETWHVLSPNSLQHTARWAQNSETSASLTTVGWDELQQISQYKPVIAPTWYFQLNPFK